MGTVVGDMGGVGNGAENVVGSAGAREAFVGEAAGTETLLHRSMKTLSLLGGVDGANVFAEGDVVEVACHQILQGRVERVD